MQLDGKRAIITGAAGGIGRATVRVFLREGARIVLVDRDQRRADSVAAELTKNGGTAIGVGADVSTEHGCQAAVEAAVSGFGGIDVLFNNAGIIRRADITGTSVEDWDRVFAVNVRAVFLMSRLVVPVMAAGGGGSIINTGSGWGLTGGANAVSYCASKAAVVNLTRAMAIDHGPHGIRVNSVNPGDTDTPMLREEARQLGADPEAFLREAADRPLQRMGRPEEIAEAVLWLASDASSFVTGAALPVDGGGIA